VQDFEDGDASVPGGAAAVAPALAPLGWTGLRVISARIPLTSLTDDAGALASEQHGPEICSVICGILWPFGGRELTNSEILVESERITCRLILHLA
jgi:hypothetical protein